ncbi:MAG: helix-turn-helix transcriptional regulator [Eubacterium sp.]|nr:helix-turn-helix transcriptional regulator [Eubacterium sp.]
MKIIDKGVLSQSVIDFTIPSSFARETLYYPIEYGDFFCDQNYVIERKYLDRYLMMYVRSGSVNLRTSGREGTAESGQVILLDCRGAHSYWCTEDSELLWIHFDGCQTDGYTRFLWDKFGSCIMCPENPEAFEQCLEQMFALLRAETINEHKISLQICNMLTLLADADGMALGGNLFEPVIQHIRENYDKEIMLDDLMEICGLSKSYFIREFKKQIGSTPHEYLLAYRLRQAKQMLQTSGHSIEEIAEECGFNSTSHFARAFKKENQMTPTDFRNIRF